VKSLTLTVKNVPDRLADLWETVKKSAHGEDVIGEDVKRAMVLRLIEKGELSTKEGAEFLGVSWDELIQIMARAGVPYLNYDKAELEADISAAEHILKQLGQL
jgi:predicted HTH domain antitoxin